ncbi:MAG: 3-keto-disaccharide hydrolase [Phycisphaerae bacterium]
MTGRSAILTVFSLACLSASGGCATQSLFDGTTLAGWQAVGNAVWKVEDGMIVGTQDAQRRAGDLVSEKDYGDFELDVTYKVVWPANSGIWFRWNNHKGYQFDILEWPNPVAYSGTLYCDGQMFLARQLDKSLENRDGWNHARISAVGDHLQLWLNGKKTADVHDSTYKRGRIGFQIHPGDQFKDMKILIRDVRIRVLDKPGS